MTPSLVLQFSCISGTGFLGRHQPLLAAEGSPAEFTKYAANAMLATKISFMNEGLARLRLLATKEEATEGADPLVICTEWKRYRCAGLRLEGPQFRSVGISPAPQADL